MALTMAAAAVSPEGTIDLGAFHVGDLATEAIAVSNTATPPADGLDASFDVSSSLIQTSSTIDQLAAGQTDTSDLTVALTLDAAGVNVGTTAIDLASDDGLGDVTPLPSVPLTVQAEAYRLADPSITAPQDVVLHVGDGGGSYATALTIANTDPADGFSENLDASVVGASGGVIVASGTVTGLAPGGTDDSSLTVTVPTDTAGTFSSDVTVAATSDGTGIDSLGTTGLGTGDVPVSFQVNNYATAAIEQTNINQAGGLLSQAGNSYTLDLGTLAAGAADAITDLNLVNTAIGPADTLDAVVNLAGDPAFLDTLANSGTVSALAGQSVTFDTVDLPTGTLGTFSETLTLNETDTNSGGFSEILPTQTVVVTGTVVPDADLADPVINNGPTIVLPDVHTGNVDQTTLSITNATTAAATLVAGVALLSGDATGAGFIADLTPGATDNSSITVGLNTSQAGAQSGTVALQLVSNGSFVSNGGGFNLVTNGGFENGLTGWTSSNPSSVSGSFGIPAHSGNYFLSLGAVGGDADTSQTLATQIGTEYAISLWYWASGEYPDDLNVYFGSDHILALTDPARAGWTEYTEDAVATSNSTVLTIGAYNNPSWDGVDDISVVATGTSAAGSVLLPSQTVTLQGNVYREASPSISGPYYYYLHVGDDGGTYTGALTVANTAPADGYSEGLDATVTGVSYGSATASGATGDIAAGQADSTSLAISQSTTNAGAYYSVINVATTSDGTGIDTLGTTSLGNYNVGVYILVDNYATATVEQANNGVLLAGANDTATIDLGTFALNSGTVYDNLAIANTASGQADFVTGSIGASGDPAFSDTGIGSFGDVSAGGTYQFTVDLATANAGVFTQDIVVSPTGANNSNYAQALPGETIVVTGTVSAATDTAVPVINSPTVIALPDSHVGSGAASDDLQPVSISNTGSADLYAVPGQPTGQAAATGVIQDLAPGGTDDTGIAVGIDDSSAGSMSGTVALSFISLGTTTTAPGGDIVVNGDFENGNAGWTESNAGVVGSGFAGIPAESGNNFLYLYGGTGSATQTLNTIAGDTYQIQFWYDSTGVNPNTLNVSFGGEPIAAVADAPAAGWQEFTETAPAVSNNTALTFSGGSSGWYDGIDNVSVTDLGTGGNISLPSQTISVSGNVYRLAAPSVTLVGGAPVLHVGDGGGTVDVPISVANTAVADGYSEGLEASVTGVDSGAIPLSTLSLAGSARMDGANVQLTDAGGEAAAAWLGTAIDADQSFDTTFSFSLTNIGDNPQADGIAFVIQGAGANVLGDGGGDIGLEGLPGNTAAIVFQSWVNDHAGIVLNSDPYSAPQSLGLGNAGTVTGIADVAYDATSQTLTLTSTEMLDGVAYAVNQTVSVDLASWVGQSLYLGFTGGTGGSDSDQEITGWNVTSAGSSGQGSSDIAASGSTGDIAAGQTNATALSAAFSTATAGTEIGAVQVAETSDGTGIDSLGLTNLGTVAVGLQATILNYATAAIVQAGGLGSLQGGGTIYAVDLGEVALGSAPVSIDLAVENAAQGPSDLLEGSFAPPAGDAAISVTTGSFSALGAGATSGSVLDATLDTSQAGIFTQQVVLDPTGYNSSGYTGTLAPETITITGTVVELAHAVVNTPSPIDFGGVREGTTPTGQAISISNVAVGGGQALDASATASGVATVSGAITQLAAGSTDGTDIEVGLNTGTAGIASGDVGLSFASEGTAGPIPLTNQGTTIAVTGTVYAEATYALSASPPVVVHVGDIVNGTITVQNTAPAPYSENLLANVIGASGSVSAAPSSSGPIAAQGSATLPYTIDATAAGTESGTVDLQLQTDGTGLDNAGPTQIGTADVPVSVTVDNYANPDFQVEADAGTGATVSGTGTNEVLNLGTIEHGSGPLTIGLGVLNDTTGPADALSGALSASGSVAFSATGLNPFAGLGAGQADTAPEVTLDTSNNGTFTQTVTLDATGSNASGYSQTLAPRTLTITGTVADLPPPTIETTGTQAVFAGVAAALSGITIGDEDPDGTFTVVVSDAMGLLSANAAGMATISSRNGQHQVTISGSLADINATLASLTYFGSAAGADTVNVSVVDGERATSSTTIDVTTSEVPNTLQPILNGPSNLTLIMNQPTGVPGISLTLPPGADPSTIYSLNISSPGAQLNVSGGIGGSVTGQGTDTITITGTVAEINSYLDDGLAEWLRAVFLGLALALSAATGGANGEQIAKIALDIEKSLQAAAKKKDEIEAAVKAAQAANEAEEIAEDVHFVTNGGNIFQFDAVGEFTLARSTQSGNDFNVQVRTQASPGSTLGSVITTLAAGFGTDTVIVPSGDDASIMLNGTVMTLAVGGTLSLAAGYVTRQSDVIYQLVWNTGEMVTVVQDTNLLDVTVGFGVGDTASTIAGLVGPGRTGDQVFVSADGTSPTGQVTAAEFAAFVNSYRVTDGTSIFVYGPGQSTATFTDLSAPTMSLDLSTLPAAVLALAENAVQAAGITDPGIAAAAELDFLLSGGDPNVVQTDAALFAGQATTPAPVDPPPAAVAFGVITEASQITTAASGATTATFMVYLSGTAAADLIVDYAVVAPDDTYLDASAFGGVLPSGQVTIQAGQSTAEFSVSIPQGALGTTSSETLEVSATPEADLPIINTTANSLIVQPQAGSPPVITVSDLASFGTFTQDGNTYLLDLGAIPFSSYPPPQINFSIANTAAIGSDDLGGTFSANSVIGFTVSGDTLAAPIQAGSAYTGLQVSLNEAKFGANSETIVYDPTDSNVSGYSAPLAPITINVAYTLEAPTMTYSQAWGDVHIITYNNLEYNFQAVGEFVLAHSTYPGDSFDIQMRLTPYDGSSSVSGISEVALQIGSDRVTLDTDRAATVWLNGAASTLTPTDSLLSLAGGSVSELSATTYKVVWNTGETATITLNGTYFSILDGIPTDETGFISGLQGENEGQQNDFQLPDGAVLAQPLSAATLYGEYADAWRVSQATSLFDYGPGQTTATYTDLNFPEAPLNTASLPAAVQSAAAAAVAAAGITDPAIAQAAITDYIATGDPSLIDAAANAQQQAGTTTAAVITPSVTPPPTIAITADATSLAEATGGPTDVGFTITLTEPAATTVTVDYAVVAPNATFLAGTDFGGTLPSGQVTFAAGQTSAPVDIAVPEDALGSRPDAGLAVMVTATDGTPVSIPEAQTVLVNPQPEAGSPAIAAFLNQTDGATFTQSGSAYTLNLGTLLLNQTGPVVNVALANIATAPADSLSGTFSAPTGGGFLVTGDDLPAAIAAGDLYTGLFAGVITDQLGAHSETLTFTPRDVNPSGYQASQTPITLTIEDVIGATALASVNTPSTIVFQNVRVGTAESQAVSVSNTAAPPAAALDITPTATGSATVSGQVTGLAAGATDTTSLTVGLSTTAAGSQNGYVTLDSASDDGNGPSQPLPESPVIDVFGNVYRPAAASIVPVLAILHVGGSGAVALAVTNTDPNDGFSENLIAALTGASGGVSVSSGGPTADIAAGATNSTLLSVSVSTTQAAVLSGSATVALTTDGGTGSGSIDGLGQQALTPQTVALTITVDNFAQAAFEQVSGAGTLTQTGSAYTLALGTVTQGAAVSATVGVLNDVTGPADLLSGAFTLSAANAIDLSGFGAFSGLGASQADTALDVSLDTSSLGAFTRTVTLTANGSNASGYIGPAQTETLTITGTVAASQIPVLSAPAAITAQQGVAVVVTGVGVSLANGASSTGRTYTVAVGDTFGHLSASAAGGASVVGAGSTNLSISGTLGQVDAALATLTDQDAQVSTDSITVAASDSTGLHATQATILVGHTFVLTKNIDTVAGGPGPDVVQAASATLTSGDTISGGGGSDTLALTGAGTFNLAAPASIAGIGTITAQEGQAAYGGIAAQNQIVSLRNGMDATVIVAADPALNPANPHAPSITIVGAQNAATIQLASGNDTVTVGDPRETVLGGSGNDTIIVSQTTVGGRIDGGGGVNTLNVTGGGSLTMGSNITNVQIVTLSAAATAYSFTANGLSGLLINDASSGADTVTAGGISQTLTGGGAGRMTFIGSSAGGDVFSDASTLFNGDTISGFGAGGDSIDITDILSGTGLHLGFDQTTTTSGVLTVSNGTHSASINLIGQFSTSRFTHVADSGNGVSIGYTHA